MKRTIFTLILIIAIARISVAQEKTEYNYTLQEVLKLAEEQSPDAIKAKHQFRAKYWQYRTFVAKLRPNLTLESNLPSFSRSITSIKSIENGSVVETFSEENRMQNNVSLNVYQNIGFTGGQIFVNSELQRIDQFNLDTSSYRSTPVNIGIRQPILGFNSIKWEKKIEPLKYEEAKREYLESIEDVSLRAVDLFFNLILAQRNLEISQMNYSNADTLYKIAEGRYNIGTIAENELLQMELNFLNSGLALNEARLDVELKQMELRSFLGFNDKVSIRLREPQEIKDIKLIYEQVLDKAIANNPEFLSFERQMIELDRDVANARAQSGLNADLVLNYGRTKSGASISEVFEEPQVQQGVQLGFELPILDWGRGKGQLKMAQSNRELSRIQIEQARTDFEQNIYLRVMEFNMQQDQVEIAKRADEIAQSSYDITKQRFLVGKVDVLDLNNALKEKDQSKRSYVAALHQFWYALYNMRKLTLFDFENQQQLEADFDLLVD